MLPVDLRLGKVTIRHGNKYGAAHAAQMMILGTIFQCLEPTLTIAAMLSSKPLFINPMDKRDEATQFVSPSVPGLRLTIGQGKSSFRYRQ